MEHPAYQKAHAKNVRLRCEKEAVLVVEGAVQPDLESIFRRGADWELGLEHIYLLQVS